MIAIVGVVIALPLPAVQQVRNAAAKVKCANNLHQIGLAFFHYHDTARMFPSGMRYQNGLDPYPLMSWQAQLLPYIEQESLWAITTAAYRQNRLALINPPHIGLATVVDTYLLAPPTLGFRKCKPQAARGSA